MGRVQPQGLRCEDAGRGDASCRWLLQRRARGLRHAGLIFKRTGGCAVKRMCCGFFCVGWGGGGGGVD